MVAGVVTFCVCAVLGVILAFATGVIGLGICGPTDGPNAGTLWAYVLLGFPFIASAAVATRSFKHLNKRRKDDDIEGIGPKGI